MPSDTPAARPEDGLVEVTQADRDAAAEYHTQRGELVTARFIRDGERDNTPGYLVQVLARHRLQSLASAEQVAREKALQFLREREELREALYMARCWLTHADGCQMVADIPGVFDEEPTRQCTCSKSERLARIDATLSPPRTDGEKG